MHTREMTCVHKLWIFDMQPDLSFFISVCLCPGIFCCGICELFPTPSNSYSFCILLAFKKMINNRGILCYYISTSSRVGGS